MPNPIIFLRFIKSRWFIKPQCLYYIRTQEIVKRAVIPDELGSRESSNGANKTTRKSLQLMKLKEIIWPHPIKTLKSYVIASVIRHFFDETFSLSAFLAKTDQIITQVSGLVSRGELSSLKNIVSKETLKEIHKNYEELDVHQRNIISIDSKDIFLKFVYEAKLCLDRDSNKRYVEILVVHHGCPGFSNEKHNSQQSTTSQKDNYICNYCFICELNKRNLSDWKINKLNHFLPKEHVQKAYQAGIISLFSR